MKLLHLFIVLLLGVVCGTAASRCPPKNKVQHRTPICRDDYDCRKNNQICCPDDSNSFSCTYPDPYGSGKDNSRHKSNDKYNPYNSGYKAYGKYDNSGYKAFGKPLALTLGTAWTDCEGVKCMPYQVCKEDRYTKKMKCQLP
ncbi:uncharacterized protein LOC115443012 [Manduca sexta]|uniref:uncharacterized protein LOC115443012 n=1 Tax=Manduca sexta TaxID=7130 RepID=UPI00188F779F|nr:uncharacterized protein LOC115443012 [Manduca sexta]